MRSVWSPGPVFVYETMLEARRWQVYALRSALVLLLLVGLAFVWLEEGGFTGQLTLRDLADLSAAMFFVLAIVQVSLVLLAAPAAAAGSICGDRSRGTLAHMMVTDLSDREIVLGKLGSRLAPVFAIILAAAPVSALGGLMGGLDFPALGALFLESVAIAVFGVTLALAMSTRAEQPREVLMAVYAAELLWLMALPFWYLGTSIYAGMQGTPGKAPVPPRWLEAANPFVLAIAPYNDRPLATPGHVFGFCLALLGASALLLWLTIRGLRRAAWRAEGRPAQPVRRRSLGSLLFPSVTGPTLEENPILWREWHRNRPSRWERRLRSGQGLICWGLILFGFAVSVTTGSNDTGQILDAALGIHVFFGFLMLSVAAPSALAEERVRGSLDVVLATPLSTRLIVAAKWWGMYRQALGLAALPLVAAVWAAASVPDVPQLPAVLAGRVGITVTPVDLTERIMTPVITVADFLASGAVLVSFGLLLATWVPRLGRAIAFSVTAYFAWGILWPFLVEILPRMISLGLGWMWRQTEWINSVIRWLSALSPILGPTQPVQQILQWYRPPNHWADWIGLSVVVVIKLLLAWGLFAIAARTFDRCLGRVTETRRRRPRSLASRTGPARPVRPIEQGDARPPSLLSEPEPARG